MISPRASGRKAGGISRPRSGVPALLLLLSLLSLLLGSQQKYWGARAYNLVTSGNGVREYQGPQTGARFGYNVALWQDLNGRKRVVVSAPLGRPQAISKEDENANSSAPTLPLGTLYFCPVDGDCDVTGISPNITDPNEVAALREGPQVAQLGIGFGETLYVNANSPSKLVSCAPRSVKLIPKTKRAPNSSPALQSRGVCYVFSQENETSALRLNTFTKSGFVFARKTGWSQGGTSALLDQNGSTIYMSGPVAFFGQGGIWKVLLDDKQTTIDVTKSRVSEQKMLDFSYYGWAMTWGSFRGQDQPQDLAISQPNIHNLKGQVTFHRSDLSLDPKRKLIGPQTSALYGYVLAAGDFDGDGIDDLAVGAPLAGVYRRVPDGGSVFVYRRPLMLQEDGVEENVEVKAEAESEAEVKEAVQELEGQHEFGRFGTSLLVQDFDLDGRDDLLVGAPYEDAGVVYLFHGSEHGLIKKPSQVIRASDFSLNHRGFGFSLGGGLDVDDNRHPDVVVGSWKSDTAILIKSAPIVQLVGQVVIPPTLQLDDRSCQIILPGQVEEDMVCFTVSLHMASRSSTYNGKIKMAFHITLEAGHLIFRHNMSSRSLTKEMWIGTEERVDNISMLVKPYPQLPVDDVLSFHVNASLVGYEENSSDNRPLLSLPPVMDKHNQTKFHVQVPWACNDSNACFLKTDLKVNASADTLIIGQKSLGVSVLLEARGFAAYQVILSFKFPHQLMFSHSTGSFFLNCSERASEDDTKWQDCQIMDALIMGHKMALDLHFEYDHLALIWEETSALNFTFEVQSANSRTDSTENTFLLHVPLETKLDAKTSGLSTEELILVVTNKTVGPGALFNASKGASGFLTPDQIGPSFKHIYSIINEGPSPILTAQLTLELPFWVNDQRQILFLPSHLQTSGPINCTAPPLSPLNHKLKGYDSDEDEDYHEYGGNATEEPFPFEWIFSTQRTKTSSSLYDEYVTVNIGNNATMKRELRQRRALDDVKLNPRPMKITCNIQGLTAGMEAKVAVPATLVVASILEFPTKIHKLAIVSRLTIEVTSPRISSYLQRDKCIKQTHASTSFRLIYPKESLRVLPLWWLPINAAFVAFVLLLMICLVLYQINFFKRKRPPQKPRQEHPDSGVHLENFSHVEIEE